MPNDRRRSMRHGKPAARPAPHAPAHNHAHAANGPAGPPGPPSQGVLELHPKGFGFLRPDDGGRDIFFHVSRLVEGLATDLRPGARVMYELGMDRTGKMAASSVRIALPPA